MTSPPTFISFSPSSNISDSSTVSSIETSATTSTTNGFSALKTESSVSNSATPYSTTINTMPGSTAGTSTHSFASTTKKTTLSTSNATRPSTFIAPTTTKFVPVYLTDLVFRSLDIFIVELNDSNSQAFKSRAELVRSQLRPVYRAKYPSFIEVIVLRFRPGSIITETQLIFNSTQSIPTIQEISDTLFTAVIKGDVNPLNITPYSISVNGSVINMTTSTTASTTTTARTVMTTTTTTTTTTLMTKRRPLTSTTKVPTTTTTQFIPVYLTSLVFRSFDIFIVELSDVNSQAFKSRADLVRSLLEPIFKAKYPSFIRIIVLSFRPGSIITDTELVFNATQALPTVQDIANALWTAVVTGSVDPLKIIPITVSVNGSVIATTAAATTTTIAATTTASSGLKIESSLLQATWLIFMAKILKLFL
ncbi:mucin-5AC-like [Carassius gibelio]|uniref:mucin-5AC-like n=1 Tax=Carassius gibelio TaxID=101364 RepID=UPI0022774EC5|nr:mucin-5AC-like [Carassius gibelio]